MEIVQVALDQSPLAYSRQLILVDKNRDMYLTQGVGLATNKSKPPMYKLATMVESVAWNQDNQLLSAIVDGRLMVWYYPEVVFVDPDLIEMTQTSVAPVSKEMNSFKQSQIAGFYGLQCLLRRADGAIVHAPGISPYPVVLMEVVRKKQWEDAVKLCRYINVNHGCRKVL